MGITISNFPRTWHNCHRNERSERKVAYHCFTRDSWKASQLIVSFLGVPSFFNIRITEKINIPEKINNNHIEGERIE